MKNAAKKGDVGKIAALGEQNPRLLIEPVESDGWTALMWTAARGHAAAVSLILSGGGASSSSSSSLVRAAIDVNAQSDKGWRETDNGDTALILACRNGHASSVKLLLAHADIDVNVRDNDGKTALDYAIAEGKDACAALLR